MFIIFKNEKKFLMYLYIWTMFHGGLSQKTKRNKKMIVNN